MLHAVSGIGHILIFFLSKEMATVGLESSSATDLSSSSSTQVTQSRLAKQDLDTLVRSYSITVLLLE